MKFAVDRALENKRFETAPVGESLARVLKYWSVRDKFSGVHEDLRKIGVTHVEVTESGLLFVGDITMAPEGEC